MKSAKKSGEESLTPPPRFRIVREYYLNYSTLIDSTEGDLCPSKRMVTFNTTDELTKLEAALLCAVNRLAAELDELKKATSK